jgi:protease I
MRGWRHDIGNHSDKPINGKRIAILVEALFDDDEFMACKNGLVTAGADVVTIGPTAPSSFSGRNGLVVLSDQTARQTSVKEIDAIVIPGGFAPDKIRMRHAMVDFVRDIVEAGKPVAAISHGPQLLISVNAVRDRKITCWPSIAIDVKNAGGLYMDRQVVVDGNIITARKIDDVPALTASLVQALSVPADI